jgi:hypothetical protein
MKKELMKVKYKMDCQTAMALKNLWLEIFMKENGKMEFSIKINLRKNKLI